MSDEEEKGSGGSEAKSASSEMIEEMYRLAEVLMEASENNLERQMARKRIAAVQMADLLNSINARKPRATESKAEHRWVLDVLNDLASYAEQRDLPELHRILVDARFQSFRLLE